MDIYNITFNTSFQDCKEMKLETVDKKLSYMNAFEKYSQEFFFYSDANIVNVEDVDGFIQHVKNYDEVYRQVDQWHFLAHYKCPNLIVKKKTEEIKA